jgi:hypothetical protein
MLHIFDQALKYYKLRAEYDPRKAQD